MQSLVRVRLPTVVARRSVQRFSTAAPDTKRGALRPNAGIPVKPDHGLYGFFRQRVFKEDEPGFGTVEYETLEAHLQERPSGRSWSAAELRRKSFKDLHTLWYVLLRERNLLYTSEEEARREGIEMGRRLRWEMAHSCRKSMARIKFVLNERRVAYEGAVILDSAYEKEMMEPEVTIPRSPYRSDAGAVLGPRTTSRKEAGRAIPPENPKHGGRPAKAPRRTNPDGTNAKKPKYTAEQKAARKAERETELVVRKLEQGIKL